MIVNEVKILVLVEEDGHITYYTDAMPPSCPLCPTVQIYTEGRVGYVIPLYAPERFEGKR